MTRDSIELGPAPANEEPVPLDADDYVVKAHTECCAYREQLKRAYRAAHGHDLPGACFLRIKPINHDFGTYYEVAVSFDHDDALSVGAAIWFEAHVPKKWDRLARAQLRL